MKSINEIRGMLAGVNRDKGPWRKKKCKISAPPSRKNIRQTNPNDTEATVKSEVLESAKAHRILLFRQQAGQISMGSYYMNLAPKGAADLTGIIPYGPWFGRRLEVECKKRYGGTQSEDQIAWQKMIEENGGVYLLVHSGSDFWEQLQPYLVDAERVCT